MSNVNNSHRKTIYCIFGVIFFCAFRTYAAVSSPDSDNAALLYYQAFLLRPEIDDDTFLHFNSVLHGAQPDEDVRKYLNMIETRETIRIAEAATKILNCNWEIRHSSSYSYGNVLGKVQGLAGLLEVDARTLAFDGDYRAALDRCLSIRRLAQHIADEQIIGYIASLERHWQAFHCIQHILRSMSVDRDTLTWLQGQISTVQGPPPPPGRALEITLDDVIKSLNAHPEILEIWIEGMLEITEDESVRQEILSLTYEELLGRAKESYNKFLSSVNRVIGSDIPYQQKHLQLKQLEDEFGNGDLIVRILSIYVMTNVVKQNDIYVRNIAKYNALRTAIEIYLVKAETGQLPETLPAHLPEDPFSGQDFEYEIMEEGFVLRCREKEIGRNILWEYKFVMAQ